MIAILQLAFLITFIVGVRTELLSITTSTQSFFSISTRHECDFYEYTIQT